jgi:hypothetical protein
LAGTFVEPKGTIRSVAAGALNGVAGVELIASPEEANAGASPLSAGGIAYLGITPDAAVLFHAKRGLFSPRSTDQVIATAARSEVVGASLHGVRLGSLLMIAFRDGSTWQFDIPKVHKKGAQGIVEILTGHPAAYPGSTEHPDLTA